MEQYLLTFLFMVIAYLCGSICSAIIISNTFGLPDPRTEGSQNPGATNVLRLSGKKYALMTLFFDVLKGFLPVLAAKSLGLNPTGIAFVCFAAVFGHMFPFFYQFKGGKGIATAMGALIGFHFMLGVVVIATWLVIANFSRYSSLASLISMILVPFYTLAFVHQVTVTTPLIFIALFVIFKHRNNITRLIDGTEPHIILKSPPSIEEK